MQKFIEAYIENNIGETYTIPNPEDVERIYNFYLKKLSSPKYKDPTSDELELAFEHGAKKSKIEVNKMESDKSNVFLNDVIAFFYGIFYEINENYNKMLYYMRWSAKENYIPAIRRLANFYYTKKDNKNYINYLLQGAALEDPVSLFNLAEYFHIYENDIKQFKHYHKIAADLNYKKSMKALAQFYNTINLKPAKCEHYYLQAVALGSISAMRHLGDYYYNLKRYNDMKKYYIQAIAAGDFRAAELLARYYLDIEENIELGVEYYIQSTDITIPENIHYLYKKFKYHKAHLYEFHANLAKRFAKFK